MSSVTMDTLVTSELRSLLSIIRGDSASEGVESLEDVTARLLRLGVRPHCQGGSLAGITIEPRREPFDPKRSGLKMDWATIQAVRHFMEDEKLTTSTMTVLDLAVLVDGEPFYIFPPGQASIRSDEVVIQTAGQPSVRARSHDIVPVICLRGGRFAQEMPTEGCDEWTAHFGFVIAPTPDHSEALPYVISVLDDLFRFASTRDPPLLSRCQEQAMERDFEAAAISLAETTFEAGKAVAMS